MSKPSEWVQYHHAGPTPAVTTPPPIFFLASGSWIWAYQLVNGKWELLPNPPDVEAPEGPKQ